MKYLALLSLVFFLQISWSQLETIPEVYEYNNGKKYIVHVAQQGNTLWGIHTLYGVSVDDIVKANPGIEKGVKEGYRYLIPKGDAELNVPNGSKVIEHVVVKGETAFSIARKYNASVDDLLKYNAGIDKGINIGQVLKVVVKPEQNPVNTANNASKVSTPTITFSDSILSYEVKPSETLYTISKRFMVPVNDLMKFNNLKSSAIKQGDVLKIPLKKERVKQVEIRDVVKHVEPPLVVDKELIFKPKDKYNIAVLLTFGLDDLASNSALQQLATNYYMGVELAIDSLERKGLDATIRVVDVPLDSVGLMKILNTDQMKGMDLIFAPLLPKNADIVGRWCKQQKIRMVCASACNSTLLKGNPYIYASVTTDMTHMENLATYTIQDYSTSQIILVKPTSSKDIDLYDAYRNQFFALSKSKGNIKLIEATPANFTTFIRKEGETVLIYPSRDKIAVLDFMNNVHKSANKGNSSVITVFGTKEWGNFDDLKGYYKSKYNVTWATTNDLNYSDADTQILLRQFRRKYRVDMDKVSAHGFDVVNYFVSTLLMQEKVEKEVVNAFHLKEIAPGGGYENKTSIILKHENFQLVRKKII